MDKLVEIRYMKYIPFKNYGFSQLVLGTVQLGVEYGISNELGKPSSEQAIQLLKHAQGLGINSLDTAREYGTSEAVIAEAMPQLREGDNINVITKFRINPDHEGDLEKSWAEVLPIVQKSIETLGVSKLDAVMFHRSPKNNLDVAIKSLPTILERLIDMELIDLGGMSAHYPGDVEYVLDEKIVEVIQVPFNLFDSRLLNIPRSKLEDKLMIARSIFLQGLFFMDPESLTGPLAIAKEPLIKLREISHRFNLSIAELAVSFARDQKHIDCLVIGAVTEAQVEENVSLIKKPPLSTELMAEIRGTFSQMDDLIITPGLWPAKK